MIQQLDIVQISILATAVCSVLLLCIYYFYFFTGFKKLSSSSSKAIGPVSVVIAARNERENLSKNLPAILEQKFDFEFEVVVVNDGSFDGSKDFLENLAKEHSNLKVVTLEIDERFQKGKKFALTIGIKAATHEHLLLTDADCTPSSDQWIQRMSSSFMNKQIVLGYAPLKVRLTPLGSLISYETFHTAIQYFGYANKQKTYMGVGRNLAYTKDLFFSNKGFATHQHIMSGDDDLFIQEVASKTNVSLNLDQDAFTSSPAPKGVSKWIKQKVRHLSTSKEYKTSIKLLLGFYSFLQLVIYLSLAVFAIFYPTLWVLPVSILGFKWLMQWIVMFNPARILNAKKILYALPYYDFLYTLFLIFFGITKPFLKPKTWN